VEVAEEVAQRSMAIPVVPEVPVAPVRLTYRKVSDAHKGDTTPSATPGAKDGNCLADLCSAVPGSIETFLPRLCT